MQSLAGALVTGTHGTGARLGNLASGVEAMELVLADGSERVLDGGDELRAARVSLGALGVVAAVTLRCVPSFRLHAVDRPLPLDDVLDGLDYHVDGNDHFELFTFPHSPLALTRTNNRTEAPPTPPRRPRLEWLQDVADGQPRFWLLNRAARRAARDPAHQPRGRSRRRRSASGWLVVRRLRQPAARALRGDGVRAAAERAAEAVRAAREILERHPVSFPIELRFSAGDDALLSPAYARDSAYVAVHLFEGMAFEAPFREVEAVMRGLDGRPHWGKRSFLGAAELAPRYPRWADFAAIRERLDPRGGSSTTGSGGRRCEQGTSADGNDIAPFIAAGSAGRSWTSAAAWQRPRQERPAGRPGGRDASRSATGRTRSGRGESTATPS